MGNEKKDSLSELLATLPAIYDHQQVEAKWRRFWEEENVFAFDHTAPKERVYSVDTPPPTVSGDLHIGHVFSYTHQDFIVRYKRMAGFEVFYPFGFDDNGLPTERLVEKTKGVRASELPREEFTRLCLEVSQEQEQKFKELWQAVGLSCDWTEVYSTISEISRRISQRSFLDLLRKGEVYLKEAPTLWCTECRTAIAQAEVADKEEPSEFHEILFGREDGGTVAIATTRPELLPACVSVFYNPQDERYKPLKGKKLRVPHFGYLVPVMEDEKVDPEKGTGIVMCCTFGDTVDIEWWQTYSLDTRIILDEDGKLTDSAMEFKGLTLRQARKAIVEALRAEGLLTKSEPIVHLVSAHERCGTPLEFLITKQWFIKVLDKKEELIRFGGKCRWFPQHMEVRYRHWVENLKWDWCISRQRYYGVPFPIWYCGSCWEAIPAREEDLPVNPLTDKPPVSACPKCGSEKIIPEKDVLDTWATSSLTPQINARWGEKDDRMNLLFPMSLRPQAHDIIRTWAFYTIAKAYFHQRDIPWRDLMISGHALDLSREKISKSKSVTVNPREIIRKFSADVVRHWAGRVKLGTDTFINLADPSKNLAPGKRLVTKLYNASKLVHQHLVGFEPDTANLKSQITYVVDRWIIAKLAHACEKATQHFEEYDFAEALTTTENFFWNDFCDNYLELVKGRLYGEMPKASGAMRSAEREAMVNSAKATLFLSLETILKLFSPFIPYVTEEIWSWKFAGFSDKKSIHRTRWPISESFLGAYDSESEETGEILALALALARKAKSELKISIKKQAKQIIYGFSKPEEVNPAIGEKLQLVKEDLLVTANVDELVFVNEALNDAIGLEHANLRAKLIL